MRARFAPVGIDIGTREVRLAQMVRRAGTWRLGRGAAVPRVHPGQAVDGDEAERIADVMARRGFAGSRAVLLAPYEETVTTILELPPRTSGAPIDQIARAEIAREHKLSPSAFELAMWDLPRPARAGEATYAMATACPHDAAEALLTHFDGAGLAIEALDSRCVALARAAGPLVSSGAAAILDVSWTGASLVILTGGTIVYERRFAGMARLHEMLREELGAAPELADHLLRTVGVDGGAGRRQSASRGGSRAEASRPEAQPAAVVAAAGLLGAPLPA